MAQYYFYCSIKKNVISELYINILDKTFYFTYK